ncbi:Uracil DNA glycosylase superfamily [Escherichia coli]|uniref:uracil-DNA glycosylase family protein n=1 Tax=Escherichia coli TaxID=562 RepID=UPI00191AA373|nr:uracil-DNA glycosylase family protein [Escherichia coli]CAD5731921.1 Uracil DNA glycosylase superfamily [Escherichia coli]CAD5751571.1 Uracil DNA glycosylase superfamily [Escherichia coli]
MKRDINFTLKNKEITRQRYESLYLPHIAPLTRWVQSYKKNGTDMPWFDPADGGINARILILLQSPAKSELSPRFVSQDNPGPSQQNLNRFLKQAKIKRQNIIIWNTIPWLMPTNTKIIPTRENINKGLNIIKSLMPLLKNLRVILLAGSVASKTRIFLKKNILI